MGDQPDDWTWFRTQPIVVRLNVAELIEDEHHHPGLMGLDEALENFGRRYESARQRARPGRLGPRASTRSPPATPTSTGSTPNGSPPRPTHLADRIPGLSADVYVRSRHRSEQPLVVDRRPPTTRPNGRQRSTRARDLARSARRHTACPTSTSGSGRAQGSDQRDLFTAAVGTGSRIAGRESGGRVNRLRLKVDQDLRRALQRETSCSAKGRRLAMTSVEQPIEQSES